jgi:hypothetical protein
LTFSAQYDLIQELVPEMLLFPTRKLITDPKNLTTVITTKSSSSSNKISSKNVSNKQTTKRPSRKKGTTTTLETKIVPTTITTSTSKTPTTTSSRATPRKLNTFSTLNIRTTSGPFIDSEHSTGLLHERRTETSTKNFFTKPDPIIETTRPLSEEDLFNIVQNINEIIERPFLVKSSTIVASKHSEEMTTDFEFYDSNIDPISTEIDTVIPLDGSKLKCKRLLVFE